MRSQNIKSRPFKWDRTHAAAGLFAEMRIMLIVSWMRQHMAFKKRAHQKSTCDYATLANVNSLLVRERRLYGNMITKLSGTITWKALHVITFLTLVIPFRSRTLPPNHGWGHEWDPRRPSYILVNAELQTSKCRAPSHFDKNRPVKRAPSWHKKHIWPWSSLVGKLYTKCHK